MVKLMFRPTDDPRDMPAAGVVALSGKSVTVKVTGDQRPAPLQQIGVNVEERNPRPVSTPDDVDAFIRSSVEQVLAANGARAVPAGAQRVLALKVLTYFVQEGNTYSARVTFAARLTDAAGTTLWEGPMAGSYNHWGHSFDEQTYLEALSNATMDAVKSLLGTPAFAQAAAG